MENAWFIAVDTVCGAMETEPRGTFLVNPKEVAKLPSDLAALEGKNLRENPGPGVDKGPVKKAAFFTNLAKMAHFFMLPKPIVKFVNKSGMVSISEQLPELPKEDPPRPPGEETPPRAQGEAVLHKEGPKIIGVTLHIPGATDALAEVGQGLGGAFNPKDYKVLDLTYHEMTHAWLWLQEFTDDGDIKKLYTDGVAAYADAKDGNDRRLDAEKAFLEAAAYYVQDRVFRWCEAIAGLEELLSDRPPVDVLQRRMAEIVEAYDAPLDKKDYGTVGGVAIKSPTLSDEELRPLRDAIDKKILDGRPLTKKLLNDTPLARVRDAIWGWGP